MPLPVHLSAHGILVPIQAGLLVPGWALVPGPGQVLVPGQALEPEREPGLVPVPEQHNLP